MSRHHKARINNSRWERVRRKVLDRDGWRCRECGAAGQLEVDHVTPLDRGGAVYDTANLQSLCPTHHIAKTARENRREPESTAAAREAWRDYCRTLATTAPESSRIVQDGRNAPTRPHTLARR